MSISRRSSLLTLGVLAITGAPLRRAPAQQSQPALGAPVDTAAILASARPEIEAANATWVPGMRHRNAEEIAAAYADSGLYVAVDGTVVRGREAVTRMYTARFPRLREILGGAVVQDGMAVVGPDRICEWGHAWLEMVSATAGGAPVRSGGGYVTIWQRQGDGHWHIVRNVAI